MVDRPAQDLLVDEQQLVCVLAVLAHLAVENHHLLQVLLRVLLVPQTFKNALVVLDQLARQFCLVPDLLGLEVLLQLALLKLEAPLSDPVDKVPERLEDDPVENLGVDDLSQSRLRHEMQLQIHPNKRGVCL